MTNGRVTKATNRELRRAFGSQAVGLIDAHADQMKQLEAADTATIGALLGLRTRIETLEAFTKRPMFVGGFWARLRWLLTGR